MTGGIHGSQFEAMKAPHVMRRRVSYTSNGEKGKQKKKRCTNLCWKYFVKTSECYVDVSKVQFTFRGSSEELLKANKGNFLSIKQLFAKYDTVLNKLFQLSEGSPKYLSPLIQIN